MDDQLIKLAEKETEKYLGGTYPQNSIPPTETPDNQLAETNSTQFLSWTDFLAQEESDSESWLIEDVLRQGWLGVIGGHGKQGKTTLTMHMLNALRLGSSFIAPCVPTPVMYINFEMSPYDTRALIAEVVGSSDSEGEEAMVVNQPPIPLNLEWLERNLAKQKKPGVCVIDSFRGAFLLGGDTENQAGTVGVNLRKLQNIARRTHWTILIIHHFRKSGTGEALDLAGSGEWLSAPDVILTWDRPRDLEPGTLKLTGRIPPIEPLSINVTREKITFLGTVSFQEADSQRKRILEVLTDEWVTTDEIVEAITDIPAATVRRRLKSLYDIGQIERSGKGTKGDSYKWKTKTVTLLTPLDNRQKSCYLCGSTKFWTRHDGVPICSVCHPIPNNNLVQERTEVAQ